MYSHDVQKFLICLQSARQSGPTSSTSVPHPPDHQLTIPVPVVHEVPDHDYTCIVIDDDDNISVIEIEEDEDGTSTVKIAEDEDGTSVVPVNDDDDPLDDDTDLPPSGVMPRFAVQIGGRVVHMRQSTLAV